MRLKKRTQSQHCIHNTRVLFIWSTTCNEAICVSILPVLGTSCFTRYITVSAHVLIIHHSYTVCCTTIIMLLCFWFEFFFFTSEYKPQSQSSTQKSLKIYNFKQWVSSRNGLLVSVSTGTSCFTVKKFNSLISGVCGIHELARQQNWVGPENRTGGWPLEGWGRTSVEWRCLRKPETVRGCTHIIM